MGVILVQIRSPCFFRSKSISQYIEENRDRLPQGEAGMGTGAENRPPTEKQIVVPTPATHPHHFDIIESKRVRSTVLLSIQYLIGTYSGTTSASDTSGVQTVLPRPFPPPSDMGRGTRSLPPRSRRSSTSASPRRRCRVAACFRPSLISHLGAVVEEKRRVLEFC